MAYNANKNQVFFQRLKAAATAYQNLREEGQRLRDWYFQEIQNDAAFQDTEIATTAEAIAMINYFGDFERLNMDLEVTADARRISLIPFLPDEAAL